MRKVVNFLLILPFLFITSCGGSSKDGNNGNECAVLNLKVYNGEACKKDGPVVKIKFDNFLGNGQVKQSFCTGVAVTPNGIITAAHCTQYARTAYDISVETDGQIFTLSGGGISNVITHPSYNSATYVYDIGIIILSHPLNNVSPVPLLASRKVQSGDIVTIFGYGNDENLNSGVLKAGELQVTSKTTDTFIHCDKTSANQAVCGGDSGGPLIFKYHDTSYVVGLVSNGSTELLPDGKCGASNYFTNLQNTSVTNFIRTYLGGLSVQ